MGYKIRQSSVCLPGFLKPSLQSKALHWSTHLKLRCPTLSAHGYIIITDNVDQCLCTWGFSPQGLKVSFMSPRVSIRGHLTETSSPVPIHEGPNLRTFTEKLCCLPALKGAMMSGWKTPFEIKRSNSSGCVCTDLCIGLRLHPDLCGPSQTVSGEDFLSHRNTQSDVSWKEKCFCESQSAHHAHNTETEEERGRLCQVWRIWTDTWISPEPPWSVSGWKEIQEIPAGTHDQEAANI